MKLKNMPKEELELLSYTDLAYKLLEESKKPMNTAVIFKKIADLLDYTEDEYNLKIGDFYTSLTTDKRFLLLDNHEWDIRDRHSVDIVVDDDDASDEVAEEEEVIEDNEEEEEIDIDTIDDDESLDDDEDDLASLSIINDEDEDNE